MSAPEPSSFHLALRVYWEDTDAGGVVFYANYLKFFERARTEWLRALGFSQEQLRVDGDMLFMVTETSIRYLAPARLDDALEVTVQLRAAGRASLDIAQQAWRVRGRDRDERLLLAEGAIRIACVDAGTYRPRRIPNFLASALQPEPTPRPG